MNQDLHLDIFASIDLESLNLRPGLLRRHDVKYLLHQNKLHHILENCCTDYLILENKNYRIFQYSTEYFDTMQLDMYHANHRQMAHRYKVRKRAYLQEGISYIEIKEKTARQQTIKHRQLGNNLFEATEFVSLNSPYTVENLLPKLTIEYQRITLLHKTLDLKVTFDLDISANALEKNILYPSLVIAESKSQGLKAGAFDHQMKQMGIQNCRISKYCLGMTSLRKELKHNLFKPTLRAIYKLTENA